MKMSRVTSVAVLLIFAVAYGEALKCYQGFLGVSVTEEDCAGSCVTTETISGDTKTVFFYCTLISYTGPCVEVEGSKICSCNTDLCNTGSSGGGGGSGGSGGGGGGATMKPSGSSALVVTWTVTCLVAIATAAGMAVF